MTGLLGQRFRGCFEGSGTPFPNPVLSSAGDRSSDHSLNLGSPAWPLHTQVKVVISLIKYVFQPDIICKVHDCVT